MNRKFNIWKQKKIPILKQKKPITCFLLLGYLLRLLHARLTHRRIHFGIEEGMDVTMIILFILDWEVYY